MQLMVVRCRNDQNVTIDTNSVIERHHRTCPGVVGSFVGRPMTVCAGPRLGGGEAGEA